MNLSSRITIGQYVPGNSFLHHLDPRSKLLFALFFASLAFWASEWTTHLLLLGFLCFVVILSRAPLVHLGRSLKPLLWIIAFTAGVHTFTTRGGDVLFAWNWLQIHEEGVRQAVFISLRLISLILMASLLTLTTSPIALTDGVESLLRPFKRFGLPTHELAMMMSIALRFIPTLLEETDKIMKAQASRGADFETRNVWKRTKLLLPLLIPLFVSAFRRGEELALAMEARGYRGGEGRTKFRELRWSKRDVAVLVVCLALFSLFIALKG